METVAASDILIFCPLRRFALLGLTSALSVECVWVEV